MKQFLNNKKKLILISIAAIVIIAGGSFFAFGNGDDDLEVVIAEVRDLEETVNVSGTVQADVVSDLGFEVSGTVRSVSVSEGASVSAGQRLAALDLGTLSAQLRSAEAGVALKKAQTGNTAVNLDAIEEKQNTLVESAYRKLLSSDLSAVPRSDTTTLTAPTVSGLYGGGEGQYEITVMPGNVTGQFDLYTYGLENSGPVDFEKNKPLPLGTRGLFVTFPGTGREYSGAKWLVDIPNTKSSSYSTNYNAYLEALSEKERALEDARSSLRTDDVGDSVAAAELAQAEAEVDRIRAEISKRVLLSPFAGLVTEVAIDPGEIVSPGQSAVSVISSGKFGVEIELPEIDSVKVSVGDIAVVTLDALGSDVLLNAEVVSVNRTETVVDGVSVYEAKLAFVDSDLSMPGEQIDERIASGMTADVFITTDKKEGVVSLPARAVRYREDGSQYVLLKRGEDTTAEADITTGLRSTDGYFQILAGISAGDEVVVRSADE